MSNQEFLPRSIIDLGGAGAELVTWEESMTLGRSGPTVIHNFLSISESNWAFT